MTDDGSAGASEPRGLSLPGRIRLIAGAVVALVVIVVALLVLWPSGDDQPEIKANKPVIVSVQQLRRFTTTLNRPVYWAGEIAGARFELTKTSQSHVYIRYLPRGVVAGDKRPRYTTVATYRVPRAYAVTLDRARRERATQQKAPGGGLAIVYRQRTSSVYLTYPGADYLVEVYDPNASKARELALSGQVGPLR